MVSNINKFSTDYKIRKKKAKVCPETLNTVYYAHSLKFYNTAIEKTDVDFIKSKGFFIVNPNSNQFHSSKDMRVYLSAIRKCNAVYYRGSSIGVILEILTAQAMNKSVFKIADSVNKKHRPIVCAEPISEYEISKFAYMFNQTSFKDSDLRDLYNNRSPFGAPILNKYEFALFLEIIGTGDEK